MKQQKPLLLFDVDGVIIDSYEGGFKGLQEVVKELYGKDLTKEQFNEFLSVNPLVALSEYVGKDLKELLSNEETLEGFFRYYVESALFDGIKETLVQLAKTHTLVVVTSSLVRYVTQVFEREQIEQLFAAYLGANAGFSKVDKIHMAIQELGADATQAIFISDTSGDLQEAKEAGVKTVGVTWGYQSHETIAQAQPNAVVDKVEDLAHTISELSS